MAGRAVRVVAERRRRKNRRRKVHAKRRIAIGLVLVIILVVAAGPGAACSWATATSRRAARSSRCARSRSGQNSFLFAKDGSLLGAVPSRRNRQPLKLGQISPWLAKGTVAIEDRRFYQHGGVDYQGIARAAGRDLGRPDRRGRVDDHAGARPQPLHRQLGAHALAQAEGGLPREQARGRWTKNQILAAYLNEVFYGQRAYGAAAAAQTFFSRPADRLTLPQAALLAGLPQSPTCTTRSGNPRAARQRRNDVLRAMLQAGFITPAGTGTRCARGSS